MTTGGVRYKQGIVAETRPGFCRVRFDDIDGLVSAWLPVIHHKTQDDKVIWTLDIGEQVACLMDGHLEDGCIVGAVYSDADTPPVASADKFRIQFADGGSFEYDRKSGEMHVVCMGAMNVVCKGVANITADGAATVQAPSITLDTPEAVVTGHLRVHGGVTSAGDVTAAGVSVQGHVHAGVRRGGDDSGPPR